MGSPVCVAAECKSVRGITERKWVRTSVVSLPECKSVRARRTRPSMTWQPNFAPDVQIGTYGHSLPVRTITECKSVRVVGEWKSVLVERRAAEADGLRDGHC